MGIRASLALQGNIGNLSSHSTTGDMFIRFDRKHYFYPDLPQGYQITQKEFPLMKDGILKYYNRHNTESTINIERIQIEQDSARSFHDFEEFSGIDYNRAGCALLEIGTVSNPLITL